MSSARIRVRFRKLKPNAVTPRYMSEHAAGLDLASASVEPIHIEPGARLGVPTGLSLEIPVGFEGQVRPRSGLAARHGISVLNTPGTVDEGYRGEVGVILINHGPSAFTVEAGMKIAQMVVSPRVQVSVVEVAELSDTQRGAGGFGSTGR